MSERYEICPNVYVYDIGAMMKNLVRLKSQLVAAWAQYGIDLDGVPMDDWVYRVCPNYDISNWKTESYKNHSGERESIDVYQNPPHMFPHQFDSQGNIIYSSALSARQR